MADGGFEVTPDTLDEAAAGFKTASDAVLKALASFHSKADLPDSAFGNLAESKDLATEYSHFHDQVTKDMIKLAAELYVGGDGLGTTAANYRVANDASTAGSD